jgi:hypothetical protein
MIRRKTSIDHGLVLFDVSRFLDSDSVTAEYLNAATEDRNPAMVPNAYFS